MQCVCRCLTRWPAVLILAAAWMPGCAFAQAGCPEDSYGWMLFEDSNPRTPDFWREDSLSVESIVVCPDGVSVIFNADEEGQRRCVALVVMNPSRAFLRARTGSLYGDRFEEELAHARWRYATLVRDLSEAAGRDLARGGRIDFFGMPRAERPVLRPSRGLVMTWHGEEFRIRGYLDVYMTLIS